MRARNVDLSLAAREHGTAFALSLCLGFVTALVTLKLTIEPPSATTLKIARGLASFPSQYRALTPLALAWWERWSPMSVSQAEFAFYVVVFFLVYRVAYGLYRGAFDRPVAATATLVLFVALAASAAQNLSLKPLSLAQENFGVRYAYDSTQLLVVLGLAHCILARRRAAWHALFLLGTFNRETTIILVPALWLVWRRDGLRGATLHAAASIAVWMAVKIALARLFPGGTWVVTPEPFLNARWPWRVANTAMALGGLWIFAMPGWSRVPADIRRLLAAVPALVAAIAYAGNLWEIRVYNEAIPLLAPVIAAGLLGRGASARDAGRGLL